MNKIKYLVALVVFALTLAFGIANSPVVSVYKMSNDHGDWDVIVKVHAIDSPITFTPSWASINQPNTTGNTGSPWFDASTFQFDSLFLIGAIVGTVATDTAITCYVYGADDSMNVRVIDTIKTRNLNYYATFHNFHTAGRSSKWWAVGFNIRMAAGKDAYFFFRRVPPFYKTDL